MFVLLSQACQRWLGHWLVASRHLAITWTNFDLHSEKSSDNHPRAISQEISQSSISRMNTKKSYLITYINFLSSLPVTSGQWVNLGSIVAQPCITRQWANLPPAESWAGENPIVNSLAWVSFTGCWCLLDSSLSIITRVNILVYLTHWPPGYFYEIFSKSFQVHHRYC